MINKIKNSLLSWYDQNKRDMPWRKTKDPYAIWISEIMLQQTQVQTVIPYYERWMKRFPSIKKLAQAPLDDVLSYWEGLGYYSRARNLQQAAKMVLEKYKSTLPSTAKALIELPGIGPYTANAIASIAFNEHVAVVDGNVRRLLCRLFLLKDEPLKIQETSQDLILKGRAGDSNQAMMELGATICLPQKPSCLLCPLKLFCLAFQKGLQEEYPPTKKRILQKKIYTLAALIQKENQFLIRQRPVKGLLGGLWEFPTISTTPKAKASTTFKSHFKNELQMSVTLGQKEGTYSHIYTHLKEHLEVYTLEWVKGKIPNSKKETWKWVSLSKIRDFAFTGICAKIRKKVIRDLMSDNNCYSLIKKPKTCFYSPRQGIQGARK